MSAWVAAVAAEPMLSSPESESAYESRAGMVLAA